MNPEITFEYKNIIFSKHLNNINGINFTLREVDILSFILHNRGEKKIARSLNISPKTVSCHIHNIMRKLKCGSREMVLDFIEKSEKLKYIKHYYVNRIIEIQFEESLKKISPHIIDGSKLLISPNFLQNDEDAEKILSQFKKDIAKLNIEIQSDSKNKEAKTIMFSKASEAEERSYDFSNKNTYYSDFLEFIKIFVSKPIDTIIEEFHLTYENSKSHLIPSPRFTLDDSSNVELHTKNVESPKNKDESDIANSQLNKFDKYFIQNWKYGLFAILFILLSTIIFSTYKYYYSIDEIKRNIAFELPLPHKKILLDRTEILDKIDSKFRNKDGIRIVALVGIGGSGKTTLARQYARSRGSSITFEINAETKEKILSSIEHIADALALTDEDKKLIELIDNIENISERNSKLLQFITKKIRSYHDWLLIYNDVATFNDIKEYFPYDDNVWGKGRVLITTRDSNIASNYFIPPENIVNTQELSEKEKTSLFISIVSDGKDNGEIDKYKEIIKTIPSFPLDTILAAYYIKSENPSAEDYLRYLSEPENVYLSAQKIILDDVGIYTRTRFDIITLSLKQIISENHEFADILLLLSLVDSQNIPKNLIAKYKDDATLGKFLHSFKKFSLISKSNDKSFSLHNVTQEILQKFILMNIDKEYINKKYTEISNLLESYILDETVRHKYESYLLVSHIEKFLSHKDLGFNEIDHANLMSKLGSYYLYIGNNVKSKSYLEKSYEVFEKNLGKEHMKSIWVIGRLGVVYRNLGEDLKAKDLLEHALKINIQKNGKEHIETIRVSTYLGSVYRSIGDYTKAIEYLERAYNVYREVYGFHNGHTAWVGAYLGGTYKCLGNYKRAKELLEVAFNSYTKNRGASSTATAWVKARLADVYIGIEEFDKAKELLISSLDIYKIYDGDNSEDAAWSLVQLSKIYLHEKNFQLALKHINHGIEIYKKHMDDDNIIMAWANKHLASIYIEMGKIDEALALLNNSQIIYLKQYGADHIKSSSIYTKLSAAFLKKKEYDKAESYAKRSYEILSSVNHYETYKAEEMLRNIKEERKHVSM